MIVFPRLIAYELLVVDFAIRLLEYILKEQNEKSTLEQDMQSYRNSKLPYQLRAILLLNIQTRQIIMDQIELLKVLKALLQRVEVLDVDDVEGLASCLVNKVNPYETGLDEEALYRRRMRMGKYFKDLRMSMIQINKSKAARQPKTKEAGSAKKEKGSTSKVVKKKGKK